MPPCHSCSFSLSFSLSLSSVERQRRHGHAMRRRKRQYWFFGPQHSPPQSQKKKLPPPLSVLNWTPKNKARSLIFTCCAPLFRKDNSFPPHKHKRRRKSIFGVFPAYNNCVFPQNNIQDWPDDMKISHEAFEEYAARIEQDDFEVCN